MNTREGGWWSRKSWPTKLGLIAGSTVTGFFALLLTFGFILMALENDSKDGKWAVGEAPRTLVGEGEELVEERESTEDPQSDPEPETGPEQEPAPQPDPSSEPEPTTRPERSSEPEPTADEPEPEDEESELAAEFEQALLNAFGVGDFRELPSDAWPYYVVRVDAQGSHLVRVALQVNRNDPVAEGSSFAIFSLVGSEFPDLQWVEVTDGAGTSIEQTMRRNVPILNRD